MIRNSLVDTIDKYFIYLLPWICAGSFFTKKHFLVICGTVALVRMLFQKRKVFFWGDWFIFLLLNFWLVVAAFRVGFIGEPLSDSSGVLQVYDFKRSFLIALAFFVCGEAVVQRLGIHRAFKLFSVALGSCIGLFVVFVLIYQPTQIVYLYPLEWRLNYWIGWGFDDICGMLGVWFFAMVASKRNRPFDWVLYILGSLLFLSLGRRPTIFYAVLLLGYFLKDLSIQWVKDGIRKQKVRIGALIGGLAIGVFYFGTEIVAFIKGSPVVQRLLWTTKGGWEGEGRFSLVRNFLDQYNFFGLFGGYVNAATITGGLESFHNLLLDGFWYGGWIGGLLVFLGLAILLVRSAQSRSYIGQVMMLFIIVGLLMAAPPFSNQFAFALVLPLFLEYLRFVRSPKSVHL